MKRTLPTLAVMCGALLATASTALANVGASSTSGVPTIAISTPGPVLSRLASTYTMTVTNPTTHTISGAQAGVQLPSGMTLNGFGPTDSCARSNRATLPGTAFSCGLGDLSPGATATASFIATAADPFTYTDHVSAGGILAVPGGQGVSNAIDLTIPVQPGPADIQVTGSASTGSPPLGAPFSYTFQVKDNGSQTAYGVSLDDALPASLTPMGVSTDTGTCSVDLTGHVHCDIGNLAVGQQAVVVVSALAPSTSGAITNTASVAMIGPDTRPANNQVSVTVQPK